jgi:MATE family, multidrug efflux pump
MSHQTEQITPKPFSDEIRFHANDTLKLAMPAMFARAGILLLAITDTIMVGHYGTGAELAYLSLGLAPQLILMLVGIGIMQGGIVLTAQAYGAGEFETCGQVWRVNLFHGVILGLIFAVISMFGGELLKLLGIEEALAEGAGSVSVQFAWGMPGMLLYVCCNYLLEGIRQPKVGMMVMAGANLLNVALNYPFVYGLGSVIPAMGADGAVAVTSFVRWMCFFGILSYILLRLDRERYGIFVHTKAHFLEIFEPKAMLLGSKIRRLGAPMGVSQAIETSAMAGLILMAGWMGATATAAHQVTMNIVQLFYMMAIGMAAAASVRVGNGVGTGNLRTVRFAGLTAVGLIAVILIPIGIFVASFPLAIASLFTTDPAVLEIARVSLRYGGFLIAFNGTMNVFMGSLRGAGDVWVPMGLQTFSFWVVAVPLAFYFGFRQNLGAPGLIFGLFMGVLVACLLLALRFTYVSSRPISRR